MHASKVKIWSASSSCESNNFPFLPTKNWSVTLDVHSCQHGKVSHPALNKMMRWKIGNSCQVMRFWFDFESQTIKSHDFPCAAQTSADSSSLGLGVFSADGGAHSRDVTHALVLSGVLKAVARWQKQHIGFPKAAAEIKVSLFLATRFPNVMWGVNEIQ